ncbi:uncharacterized protein [Drosophila pseudoobscura]|uniref:Uncharacterized protein n=1 Tax=Drosophila pseudoobscura pseudoobscura TaxID=46245 RepID=A0A6I8UPD5_DROPS|nr:uncharacterized protein LOC4801724 [Drosophila pseudoobscura]
MELWSCLLLSLGLTSMAGLGVSLCVPPMDHCIEDMEEADAKERFDYVLAKYEELEMKIPGEPVGLHGKVVRRAEIEEHHIVFRYMDNTPHDIIQTCAFVVTNAPGHCETIGTFCSAFLPRLPRPLLERKSLAVCEDGVHVAEHQPEPEEEEDPEEDDDQQNDEGGEAEAAATPTPTEATKVNEFL